MPKVLEDRVKTLKRKGMDQSRAYAIATSSLQKEGKLKRGSNKSSKQVTRRGKK